MRGDWEIVLERSLVYARERRGVLYGVAGLVLAILGAVKDGELFEEALAKKKNVRQHRKRRQKRQRRRRRRNACKLLPSGAPCAEGAQCCSGTCDANTAFPEFDSVCCRALGESCVIGRNECCLNFACRCATPDCVDYNGDVGVCG
jgi:hypothetical protein